MYWRRPPRPRPKRDAPVPPAVAMMADEFADRPLGGFAGERLPSAPATPAPAPKPFVIEPWSEEERRLEAERVASEPPPAAEPAPMFDWDPPAPPGPPLKLEPVLPPAIPEPDWRLEQQRAEELERKEHARRRRAEKLLAELEREGT